MDDPPGPVRVRLEVAAGDLLLGAVPDEGDQLPDVGVMGAEHGKVVTLCAPGSSSSTSMPVGARQTRYSSRWSRPSPSATWMGWGASGSSG